MSLLRPLCLLIAALFVAPTASLAKPVTSGKAGHWIATWVAMPQLTETSNMPPAPFTQEKSVLADTTLRQTVHVSIGAKQLRVRFSNAFGDTPLTISSARIALPQGGLSGTSAISTATDRALTFQKQTSITIPPGSQIISDPLLFDLAPLSNLSVTIYLSQGQGSQKVTSHPGSRTTSFMLAGEHVKDADLPGAVSVNHWYFLSGIEVWAENTTAGVVLLGDSLTDGRGSTTNMNDRWPDQLSSRLQANISTAGIAVLNQAAGGNRILNDGLGPSALSRLDRDVLSLSGALWMIVFEGVNDIGTAEASEKTQDQAVADLINAYDQIIIRAHAKNIIVYGATLTPMQGHSYYDETGFREASRQKLNDWIRTSGRFDAVIDFDRIVRDPVNPKRLSAAFDSGDGLHMTPTGYKALADAVKSELFWHRWFPEVKWHFSDDGFF